MKIKILLVSFLTLVTSSIYAQKDELKTLKKIAGRDKISLEDAKDFKAAADKLSAIASDENDKYQAVYYKSIVPIIELKSFGQSPTSIQLNAALSAKNLKTFTEGVLATMEYENKIGKKQFTDDIKKMVDTYKPFMVNAAINLGNEKKYSQAGEVLYYSYLLDKNDPEKLYYAASFMVNANDYDKALEYYYELKKINFSGEGTSYLATNKASQKEESFPTEKEREIFIKAGTHEKPRNEKIPSKKGEIYKNIALILIDKGQTEQAKTAVNDARKENPDDLSLLLTEAELHLKLNDFETYSKLATEALQKNPNDVILLYNLGVVSSNNNKIDESIKYYKKAIELKPDYFDAYLNLSEVMLRVDEKYVDEMNKLGMSDKDMKRYNELKTTREKNFKAVLPYLEKAVELKPDNEPALRTLMSVYNALEMTDKYKALKAKLKN